MRSQPGRRHVGARTNAETSTSTTGGTSFGDREQRTKPKRSASNPLTAMQRQKPALRPAKTAVFSAPKPEQAAPCTHPSPTITAWPCSAPPKRKTRSRPRSLRRISESGAAPKRTGPPSRSKPRAEPRVADRATGKSASKRRARTRSTPSVARHQRGDQVGREEDAYADDAVDAEREERPHAERASALRPCALSTLRAWHALLPRLFCSAANVDEALADRARPRRRRPSRAGSRSESPAR